MDILGCQEYNTSITVEHITWWPVRSWNTAEVSSGKLHIIKYVFHYNNNKTIQMY